MKETIMKGILTAPATFVIFGASGDLTHRKLVPALYNLYRKKRLQGGIRIVGFARRPYNQTEFQAEMQRGVQQFSPASYDEGLWSEFKQSLSYFQGDLGSRADFERLEMALKQVEGENANRLYYLAVAPSFYKQVVENLGACGMASQHAGKRNIVIEKPFGIDLQSAIELNQAVHEVFEESQVYRIDHYLGKETAQNLLFFRFANTIFEPVWNRRYVDNVQITVSETVDVGHRAGYYDGSGVLRDMFQNHLMQLYTLLAMEPPASFEADALRNEKVKVLAATRKIDLQNTVLAQYDGYCQTEGVAADSRTPTYAVLKLYLDNWRWKGVPFYLRSGKALAKKSTEITVTFQRPPHIMFDLSDPKELEPNMLSICIQPDEGIHLRFEVKQPDSAQDTKSVDMEFHYGTSFGGNAIPEAYERLLLDALLGDAALFARSDEIVYAWKLVDPVIYGWQAGDGPPLACYAPGSLGPEEAGQLMQRDGRLWRSGCGEHEVRGA